MFKMINCMFKMISASWGFTLRYLCWVNDPPGPPPPPPTPPRRHDWQGSAGPVGHVDLWTQLLHENESQGTTIQWLHVPSHVGVDGNTLADQLADIGRRHSPVLKGQVTVSLAGGESLDELESEPESDLEALVMWTAMEGVGDHGTPLPPRQAASNEEREGRREQPLLTPPPPPASDHSTTQTQLSPRRLCHTPSPWATRWSGGHRNLHPPFKGAMSIHGPLHPTLPLAISGPVSGTSSPLPSDEIAYTD